MRTIPLLILLLAPARDSPLPEYTRLTNGIRLCVIEDHGLPLVSVQVWHRVGAAHDPPDAHGLTHVLHTYVRHAARAEFRLRAAGLAVDSQTRRDACVLATVLPPSFLDYVLGIEAERLRAPGPSPADLAAALGTAALEAAASTPRPVDDSDHDVAPAPHALRAIFPDHPYGRPPHRLAATLHDFPADRAAEFYQRWFVPGNVTLIVYGDVQPPRVADAVRRHFGEIPWAEPPRRATPDLPAVDPAPQRIVGLQTAVHFAFRTPRAGDSGNPALHVLMQRLCNEVDGALARALAARTPASGATGSPPARQPTAAAPADVRRAARCITWHHAAWADAGVLTLTVRDPPGAPGDESASAALSDEDRRRIEQVVLDTLEDLATSPPDPIALNRARALAQRDIRGQRDRFVARALAWGEAELIAGDALRAHYALPAIAGVYAADIQAAARRLRAAPRAVVHEFTVRDASAPQRPEPLRRESFQSPTVDRDPPLPKVLSETMAARIAATLAAPEPVAPASAPRVTVEQLAPTLQAYLCPLPGLEIARVWLAPCEPSAPPSAPSPLERTRPAPTMPPLEFADYLTYHGLAGSPAGCTSPPDRAPQVIELALRAAYSWPRTATSAPASRFTLIVAGEFDREVVVEAARDLCDGEGEPVTPASPWVDAPQPSFSRAITDIDVELSPAPRRTLRLFVRHRCAPRPTDPILVNAGEYFLGNGFTSGPADGVQASEEQADSICDAPLAVLVARTEDELAREFDAWLQRLEALGCGDVPRRHAEAALRWSRTRHLIGLDGTQSVTEAVRAGRLQPWNLGDYGPDDVAAAGTTRFRHVRFLLDEHAARSLRAPLENLVRRRKIIAELRLRPAAAAPEPADPRPAPADSVPPL